MPMHAGTFPGYCCKAHSLFTAVGQTSRGAITAGPTNHIPNPSTPAAAMVTDQELVDKLKALLEVSDMNTTTGANATALPAACL